MLKGDLGKGRWPSTPPKLSLVGVVSADPSVDGTMRDRSEVVGSARGVVGDVASFEKSFSPRPTLTDWKVVVMMASLNGLAANGIRGALGWRTSRNGAQPWNRSKVGVVMHQFVRLMAKCKAFMSMSSMVGGK